jgi:hypothetical protein
MSRYITENLLVIADYALVNRDVLKNEEVDKKLVSTTKVARFKSERALNEWLEKAGKSVTVLNVATKKKASLLFLGIKKHYIVTYRIETASSSNQSIT